MKLNNKSLIINSLIFLFLLFLIILTILGSIKKEIKEIEVNNLQKMKNPIKKDLKDG